MHLLSKCHHTTFESKHLNFVQHQHPVGTAARCCLVYADQAAKTQFFTGIFDSGSLWHRWQPREAVIVVMPVRICAHKNSEVCQSFVVCGGKQSDILCQITVFIQWVHFFYRFEISIWNFRKILHLLSLYIRHVLWLLYRFPSATILQVYDIIAYFNPWTVLLKIMF